MTTNSFVRQRHQSEGHVTLTSERERKFTHRSFGSMNMQTKANLSFLLVTRRRRVESENEKEKSHCLKQTNPKWWSWQRREKLIEYQIKRVKLLLLIAPSFFLALDKKKIFFSFLFSRLVSTTHTRPVLMEFEKASREEEETALRTHRTFSQCC